MSDPPMAAPPLDEHLKTTEERLARLSVLQELTVTALDLFDPDSSADPFLERLAERLGCLAALWVAMAPRISDRTLRPKVSEPLTDWIPVRFTNIWRVSVSRHRACPTVRF